MLEDGIMTADLLEMLFGSSGSELTKNEERKSTDPEKVCSITLIMLLFFK